MTEQNDSLTGAPADHPGGPKCAEQDCCDGQELDVYI